MMEMVPDTVSLDSLKKKFPSSDWDLSVFFKKYY